MYRHLPSALGFQHSSGQRTRSSENWVPTPCERDSHLFRHTIPVLCSACTRELRTTFLRLRVRGMTNVLG